MVLLKEIKEKISIEVIKTLIAATDYLPENNFDLGNPFICAFSSNFADKLEDNSKQYITTHNNI